MPRDADRYVFLGIFVRVAALQLEGKDIFCANKWHNMHTMGPIETGDGTDLCRHDRQGRAGRRGTFSAALDIDRVATLQPALQVMNGHPAQHQAQAQLLQENSLTQSERIELSSRLGCSIEARMFTERRQ